MVDKKFSIAILIIVLLAGALLYITIVKPTVEGYFLGKQIKIQTEIVKAIISVVDQQGFIIITDSDVNRTITLVDIDKIRPSNQSG